MTNEDLLEEIDRERKWLNEAGYTAYNIDMVFSTLYKNIKSLEQEPKTGHWKRVTDKTGHLVWECNCGWQQRFATNYCPDCGSKNE